MANILIVRFSAFGDVAMTLPIIYSAAQANPDDSFTFVTQTFLIPLFINPPHNVKILGIDTKGSEKKLGGFLRFAFGLAGQKYDMVLDLHNVIRSRMLDLMFRLKGKRVYVLDKKRKERKQLTGKLPKTLIPLRTTADSYQDVFHNAGFCFEDTFTSLFADMTHDKYSQSSDNVVYRHCEERSNPEKYSKLKHITLLPVFEEKKGRWIGFAPFAKHLGKVYPVDQMEKIIEQLSKQSAITLFLFGGGGYEADVLSQWESKYPNTHCVAGRYSLVQELEWLSRMDVLVSMDSANMHFASLVGTKIVSIWGATHPYAGFYGYKQQTQYAVQVELPCRPCSIYGNKPCYRNDYACLRQIKPKQIIDKITFVLTDNNR